MALSRRDLLRGALLGSGALAFGGLGSLATAAATSDKRFVFCYFQGGWDILLGLDPRDPAVFTDDRVSETQILLGYDRVEMTDAGLVEAAGMRFGPYIGDLAQHASDLVVLRGLSMETLTHEAGQARFITGKPPAGTTARGAAMATVLAAELGAGEAIPNLANGVPSYNPDRPGWATALGVSSVEDLVVALGTTDHELADLERDQVDALFEAYGGRTGTQRSPRRTSALRFRQAAHDVVRQGLGDVFDFAANTPEMVALRGRYGFTPAQLASDGARAAMAYAAITQGVSRCVTVQVASRLDTHTADWEDTQGPQQRAGFDRVARLVADLKATPYGDTGDSWFDHTVIVGFSEFSRTAMLTARGGRDHSLTNACFLLGGGLRGGRVLGASSDVGMAPQRVDLATGQVDPGGEVVRPEHVHRSLMALAGVEDDVADLRVPPYAALLS